MEIDTLLRQTALRLKELINTDKQYFYVLRYLSSRERSTGTSDLNQFAVYAREHVKEKYESEIGIHIIHLLFHEFEKLGVGELSRVGSKLKFKWDYWLTPLFDQNQRFNGVQMKFLPKKNTPPQMKKDIPLQTFYLKDMSNQLSDVPTDMLLKELIKRGYKIKIEPS
jgi:hypothetical protein